MGMIENDNGNDKHLRSRTEQTLITKRIKRITKYPLIMFFLSVFIFSRPWIMFEECSLNDIYVTKRDLLSTNHNFNPTVQKYMWYSLPKPDSTANSTAISWANTL